MHWGNTWDDRWLGGLLVGLGPLVRRGAGGRSGGAVLLDVFDGDGLGHNSLLLVLQSHTQFELGLGLGSPVELLVDGRISRLQRNVSTRGIGVSLKDDVGIGRDMEESSDLESSGQDVWRFEGRADSGRGIG